MVVRQYGLRRSAPNNAAFTNNLAPGASWASSASVVYSLVRLSSSRWPVAPCFLSGRPGFHCSRDEAPALALLVVVAVVGARVVAHHRRPLDGPDLRAPRLRPSLPMHRVRGSRTLSRARNRPPCLSAHSMLGLPVRVSRAEPSPKEPWSPFLTESRSRRSTNKPPHRWRRSCSASAACGAPRAPWRSCARGTSASVERSPRLLLLVRRPSIHPSIHPSNARLAWRASMVVKSHHISLSSCLVD